MQLPSIFRAFLLLFLWGIRSASGVVDWESIPDGILFGPGVGNVDATDFCGVVRDDSMKLNDALRGRNLSIAVQFGPGFDFFRYDPDEELSSSNPTGMIAFVLDEVASRAGFSWRNSFVAYTTNTTNTLFAQGSGKWDKMLNWTTTNFDVSVDKWFLTTARLEREIVFLHSWFDASLILVEQGDISESNWLGFATPFDSGVWLAIGLTVVFSACFMMFIDHMERVRDNRSWSTWVGDHLYLSNMAFSQNFAYDMPRSGAGRIFLSTFSFWSMLVGATYTANLASLLVDNALASSVGSVKSAMDAELSICIHDGSASQTIVSAMNPSFVSYEKVVKLSTPTDMYVNLASKQCDVLVGTQQEFDILSVQEQHGCNLVQAGPEIQTGSASFAIKFDPLSCDSVLAYILNIHLHAMSIDGNMTKHWDNYINGIDGICANIEELQLGRRLELAELDSSEDGYEDLDMASRSLKGGGGGAGGGAPESTAFVAGSAGEAEVLQIKGMAGVFLIHGFGTAVALVLVLYTHLRRKYIKEPKLRRRAIEESMQKARMLSEKHLDTDLHRKYEDLKKDFMLQLDELFEHRLETTEKSSTSAPYEAETASDQTAPSSLASPRVILPSTLPQNSGLVGMDGSLPASFSGGEPKSAAKAYHRNARKLGGINDSRLAKPIASGRDAKLEAKAYHKKSRQSLLEIDGTFTDSTRTISTQNLSHVTGNSVDEPVQTMGSGKLAKMEAKAYHEESRRELADINESFRTTYSRDDSDIGESFRSLRTL